MYNSAAPQHLVLQTDKSYLPVGCRTHGSRQLVQCTSLSFRIVMQYVTPHLLRLMNHDNSATRESSFAYIFSPVSAVQTVVNAQQNFYNTECTARVRAPVHEMYG